MSIQTLLVDLSSQGGACVLANASQDPLFKTGERLIRHARYFILQLAAGREPLGTAPVSAHHSPRVPSRLGAGNRSSPTDREQGADGRLNGDNRSRP